VSVGDWTCIYCGAVVAADRRRLHSAWHQRYALHAPDCPGGEPGAAEHPDAGRCTCGLALWTGE
jgi:hypothetical protein